MADEQIGKVEFCFKQDTENDGHFFIQYKDDGFQGQMAAYCAEDATGYHAYNDADETQVMHITRGFCNAMRTENGVARTMETFLF
ncbi:hypothetical protein SynBIOSU31_01285 [Synechococcus sp. BIOS-U3-1]|nr:hypothetical protein SynBIOSU31_01285 [Synechococcus sp. BIOS-U3-1]